MMKNVIFFIFFGEENEFVVVNFNKIIIFYDKDIMWILLWVIVVNIIFNLKIIIKKIWCFLLS